MIHTGLMFVSLDVRVHILTFLEIVYVCRSKILHSAGTTNAIWKYWCETYFDKNDGYCAGLSLEHLCNRFTHCGNLGPHT